MPSLHRTNISWQSQKEHEEAKRYALKKGTTVSALIRKHFAALIKREQKHIRQCFDA